MLTTESCLDVLTISVKYNNEDLKEKAFVKVRKEFTYLLKRDDYKQKL